MSDENHKSPPKQPVRLKSRNPFIAGTLNLICFGLGYFYCGKFIFGIAAALLWPLLFLSTDYISIVLPEKINTVFFITAYTLLFLFPAVHAAIIAKKNKSYFLKPRNRVFYYTAFFILAISYSVLLKEATFETHSISSGSMQNTILIKDQTLIRYTYFGITNPFTHKIVLRWNLPKRNEIVVFQGPYHAGNTLFLKRVVGMPGDTVKINKRQVYVNGIAEEKNDLFVYDKNRRRDTDVNGQLYPQGAKWNEDNYGPLYIPKKGDEIKIDTSNSFIWKPLIIKEHEELNTYSEKEKAADEIIAAGKYVMKENYYFMLGDERSNSMDSRYIGLISEDEIIGKAEFVLFNPGVSGRTGIIIK